MCDRERGAVVPKARQNQFANDADQLERGDQLDNSIPGKDLTAETRNVSLLRTSPISHRTKYTF